MTDFIQARYCGPDFIQGEPRQQVVHSLECDIKRIARSLADGWFQDPSNKSSAHVISDPYEAVRCVEVTCRAWHCGNGNSTSLGYEHAGRAAFTRDQWTTPDGLAMLRNSAREMAKDAVRFDIPIRWLTDEQLAANEKGQCTHRQMRDVRGGTTHWDPGDGFPYDVLGRYLADEVTALKGTAPAPPEPTPTPAPTKEIDMQLVMTRDSKNREVWGLLNGDGRIEYISDPHRLSLLRKAGLEGVKVTRAEYNSSRANGTSKVS